MTKVVYRRELIVRLQKNWRAALVQRKLHFRLCAIKAAKQIEANLEEFEQIIGQQLKASPERANLERESHLLRNEVSTFATLAQESVREIIPLAGGGGQVSSPQSSEGPLASKRACEKHLDLLRTKRDLLIRSIRDKIAKQKELAELERQLADERAKRENEEMARRQEEQLKRQRAELELRRQAEAQLVVDSTSSAHQSATGRDEKRLVDSATDPISLHYLNAALTHEQEQEQRDYVIAMRLAQERGDSVSSSSSSSTQGGARVLPPSENLARVSQLNSAYNLTKWKYSDLRDTINTSCDLELLEACKREFHRRLKVYHAWRAMNSASRANTGSSSPSSGPTMRAPSCIMNQSAGACDELTLASQQSAEQRYFRIPFLKQPTTGSGGGQRGWWFAHFDGQWIARQLELHPNREPILLVAGQHDIDMCELSLSETRLVSKRGAEILAQEFEAEWARHGGLPYTKRRPAK